MRAYAAMERAKSVPKRPLAYGSHGEAFGASDSRHTQPSASPTDRTAVLAVRSGATGTSDVGGDDALE